MSHSATALEKRIHTDIPLTRHIGLRVLKYDRQSLVLSAPLAANANHKGTAFGGSLFSLAVLAGWGLLTLKLAEHGVDGELVIQESRVSYLLPVTGELVAHAVLPPERDLQRFLATVDRYRKGRIRLHVTIEQGGREAVRFEGTFALMSAVI
jgi:thioesterase domain-containing protein